MSSLSFPAFINANNQFQQPKPLPIVQFGYNAITYLIAEESDFEKAYRMMDDYSGLEGLDKKGRSVLHWAAFFFYSNPSQLFRIMRKCLDRGLSINMLSEDGSTPFHYLVEEALDLEVQLKMMRIMMESGADPMIRNNRGDSVFLAIMNGFMSFEVKMKVINQILMYLPKSKWSEVITDLLLLPYTAFSEVSFEENLAIIKEFARYVDVNTIVDKNGVPLILQPYTSYCFYEPEQIYHVTKALLKAGGNPNIGDSEGNTPIHQALRFCKRDLKGSRKLMRMLLKHGADPYMTNSKGVGCVGILTSFPTSDLSTKQKERMSEILFSKHIVEEMYYRRLLVNSFYIEDYQSEVFKEKIGLEGSIKGTDFYRVLLEKNDQFYQHLATELKDTKSSASWKDILNLISEETRKIFDSLSPLQRQQLAIFLRKIPALQNQSVEIQKLNTMDIANKLQKAPMMSVMVSHRSSDEGQSSHMVGYYFHQQHMLVCNRGYAAGSLSGITIHKKSSIKNFKSFVQDLKNGRDAKEFTATYLNDRLVDETNSDHLVHFLEETWQRGGHCPVASFNSNELGMLFMMIVDVVKDKQVAEDLARAIKKEHTSSRREELLRDYLDLHSSDSVTTAPHDPELLETIAKLETSDEYKDDTRFAIISEWAEDNDPELYDLLNPEDESGTEDLFAGGLSYVKTPSLEFSGSDEDERDISYCNSEQEFSESDQDFTSLSNPPTPVLYMDDDE